MYTRLVRSPGTNTIVIKRLIDTGFALNLLSYNSFLGRNRQGSEAKKGNYSA